MRKLFALLLILCMLGLNVGTPVMAEAPQPETPAEEMQAAPAEDGQTADPSAEGLAPEADNLSVTRHSVVIQGETVDYTATAGTMTVNTCGDDCSIFFVAYTREGVEDAATRPVTFAFNGGPGSASFIVNLLCMGPRRMELGEDGHASQLPAKLVDNDKSLLDITDLVFIDAPGTGHSRGVNGEDSFIGYGNDVCAFGDFIRLYITRNNRWGSPLYVAGESYGTTRAVGLCDYLAGQYGIALNGAMLISSLNDFAVVEEGAGKELPYLSFLPTMAADAWYHGRVGAQYREMELEPFIDEVRAFVSGEYLMALFKGRSLPDAERDAVAGKMAGLLGLDKAFILQHNLRLSMEEFSATLLEDQKLMLGRYDGRYTGPVIAGDFTGSDNDPSNYDLSQPLTGLANRYYSEELNWQTDVPYIPLSYEINAKWSFLDYEGLIAQEETIRNCMSANSHLKVWVLCGYYDAATPFYGAEWVFNHVFISEDRAENLSFTYYPSGHMFYLDAGSFDKFRADAEAWYKK